MYIETSAEELEKTISRSREAFRDLKQFSVRQRASFMRAVAAEIEALGDELIQTAMRESHLPEARLIGERARTMFQWTSYANYAELGNWLEVRIDTALPERTPPKPDIRKTLVALGPVVVFGAGNFPFAFSTAGGDTACAIAAGCPVIVKAHPGHPETCALMGRAIERARVKCRMPEGTFEQVYDSGFEAGQTLVKHAAIKAVAFTGSYLGGKALFDLANQRSEPIPVYAEMGSINPVFLLPRKLEADTEMLAGQFLGSVTLGVGQFCTNPGLIIGIAGDALDRFTAALQQQLSAVKPATMLHRGIASNYHDKKAMALEQQHVTLLGASAPGDEAQGEAVLAITDAKSFIANPVMHEEVFGPYSLVVTCSNAAEMLAVAEALKGQLTSTLIATGSDLDANTELLGTIQDRCGRILVNQFPTGAEVCLAMHHGGPFPATTDSRSTSVGADGIKRFARPLAYQNWPDELLPEELQNDNPLGMWRTIDNELTMEAVGYQPSAISQ